MHPASGLLFVNRRMYRGRRNVNWRIYPSYKIAIEGGVQRTDIRSLRVRMVLGTLIRQQIEIISQKKIEMLRYLAVQQSYRQEPQLGQSVLAWLSGRVIRLRADGLFSLFYFQNKLI